MPGQNGLNIPLKSISHIANFDIIIVILISKSDQNHVTIRHIINNQNHIIVYHIIHFQNHAIIITIFYFHLSADSNKLNINTDTIFSQK